jgi:hypothetical protein
MESKKILPSSALAIGLPIAMLCFNIIDLIAFLSTGGNTFRHQVFPSEAFYISYLLAFSGLLVVMIILAYKKNWVIYWILFVINSGFFLYPIIGRYM